MPGCIFKNFDYVPTFWYITTFVILIVHVPQFHSLESCSTLNRPAAEPSVLNASYLLDETACTVHTGQCKRTGGCYNELVVAFFSTGGGVKGKKIYTC